MIRFQDLTIKGRPEDINAFIQNLTERLKGWQRDAKREEELKGEYIAIRTPENGELPYAMLYLCGSNETGSYYMANIVPIKRDSISQEQYNSILQAFYDQYVHDHETSFGVIAELSKADINAYDVLSDENAGLLHRFSVLANMSTSSSHPEDGKRWRNFISHSFDTEQILDFDTLVGLLMDEGWSEELAHELTTEYRRAIEVLRNHTGQE